MDDGDDLNAEVNRLGRVWEELGERRDAAVARVGALEEADEVDSAQLEAAERELVFLEERVGDADRALSVAIDARDRVYAGGPADDDGPGTEETLSVDDAADIWVSNGMDEDYMFGYSEEELRRAGEL